MYGIACNDMQDIIIMHAQSLLHFIAMVADTTKASLENISLGTNALATSSAAYMLTTCSTGD